VSNPKLDKQSFWIKDHWKFILRLLVSLGLIGLVLFFVDLRQIGKIISSANPLYVLAVFVLISIDRVLMTYKWNLLLQAVNVRVPFPSLFNTYVTSTLSGILLPSNLGGDLFRLYSLSRHQVDTKAVLASMILERAIAFAAVIILAMFGIGLASYLIKDGWSLFSKIWLTILVIALIAGALLVATGHKVSQRWVDKLVRRFSRYSFIVNLHQVYILFYEYRNHLRTVILVSAWTLVEQLAPTVGVFLLVRALHIDVSFVELLAIVPIIVLATRLPISLDGYGVSEGMFVVLFGMVGVSASEAFSLSIVARTVPLLFALPWGIHYIIRGHQAILPRRNATGVGPR
jgi:uncharacterized protein (TIRG00374 family)